MPRDTWSTPPVVAAHGYGFSIPVAVTEATIDTDEGTATQYDGVRVEVRSLASSDIEAGIDTDPDADPEHLIEALALALDAAAPGVQPQLDSIIDLLLEA